MLKILRKTSNLLVNINYLRNIKYRTFLSQAYYCNEVWEHRLNDPLLKQVNVDELYNDLDQKFQKTRNISAVDVDIFCNCVNESSFLDELLDIVHKFRLSADTCHALNSTAHAVVRNLMIHGKSESLLSALDDRLNYGIFLDYYTANLLLDHFWKKSDFTSGARVASQLMLQEEFDHSLSANFALLHCYSYLLNPVEWPEHVHPQEPEEEVKVRVKYLRNPYDDDHFDLKDDKKIVGKTLAMLTKSQNDTLYKSLHIVGLALYGKCDKALKIIEQLNTKKQNLYREAINVIPDDNPVKSAAKSISNEPADVVQLLKDRIKLEVHAKTEQDIAQQCKKYAEWTDERKKAMEKQRERLLVAKRLLDIETSKKYLKDKETLLWYFENEEKIELEIEAKNIQRQQRMEKEKKVQIDEDYVPPEITVKSNKQ